MVPPPPAIDPAEIRLGTQSHTGLRYATCRGWRLVAYAEGGSCHQQWSGDARLGWILCNHDSPMPPDVEAALSRALGEKQAAETLPERIRAAVAKDFAPKYLDSVTEDMIDVAAGNRPGNSFEVAWLKKRIFKEQT